MKQYPPHRSQVDVGRVAMLALAVAMSLFFVFSMAGGGHGGAGQFDQPLEAPPGFGL
jgi:hypothetical protein